MTSSARHHNKKENLMTTNEPRIRIITLTRRPPVRLREDLWPIIASARRHDGAVECQANHRWHLLVRQHADGRTIVYGSEDSGPGGVCRGYEAAYAGEIVEPGADVASAILRVGTDARCSSAMQDECIADLPPVDVDGPVRSVTVPIDGARRLLATMDRIVADSGVGIDPRYAAELRAVADELRGAVDPEAHP
jgi:hypothetical protein